MNLFYLQLLQKFVYLKINNKLMKNKPLQIECKCKHCQQKIYQINSSKLYWDKLILRKNLA